MASRRSSTPRLMPVFIEGGRFGGRDLINVAIGHDLGPMLALGWRFPRSTGREVEGGGVIAEKLDELGR